MGLFNRLFNFAGKKPVAAEGFAAKPNPPKRKLNAIPLESMRIPSGLLDDASDLVIFDTDDFSQVEVPDLGDDFDGNSLDLGGDGDSDLSLEVAANNSEVSEELLTDNPDDFEDVPFIDSDDILNDGTDAEELEFEDVPFVDGDDLSLDNDGGDSNDGEILPIAIETPSPVFESGVFTVGDSGQVQISLEFDGGKYEGELAIFSLDGMEQFETGSHDFIQEAASRALSDSVLGHVVISDRTEGAKFFGELGESDWNEGEYIGVKTFEMRSGDEFGFMLIPNSTVQKVFDNPDIEGAGRPLFSLATANPNDAFHLGQIADVTGDGTTFVMEDKRVDTGSDGDYNDLIFRVSGATGKVVLMDGLIDPAHDWRTTELGQEITFNVESYAAPGKELPGDPIHPALPEPTVPQTNVDQGGNGFSELTLPHDEIVEPNQGGALPNTPTSIKASLTQDIIDQVSNIDPTDVYQVSSHQLTNTEISVLSGHTSVSILTPEGQLLSQQVLTRGTHSLTVPDNVSGNVLLKFDSQNSSNATYILRGFESKAPEPFNIDVQFESGVTASQQAVIQAAARSVESLIGQGLPSAIVDGKIIDDVNFKIAVTNLDGAGGTLAQTKIDFMRYGTLLPAQSITQFDVNDIAQLEQSGQLFSVVQHEILHGLGFGNLWEAKGLVDYAGTPLAQYNGEHGVTAFKEVGGLTDAIPLETDGEGSAGLHWHEALFQDEVMTRDLGFQTGENGQVTSPISAVTLAALVDLGYQVNLDKSTPGWGLFGGRQLKEEDLTEEQIEEFRKLAEESFAQPDDEFIYAVMPEVDPAKVAPEIWAHAERSPNGEYYDWVDYVVSIPGDGFWNIAQRTMGNGIYWQWIANHNGVYQAPYWVYLGDEIKIPVHHPNYEWEQEQERLRREAELKRQQEEEARIRREQEEAFAREQERVRQEEETRRREAEAKQRELEEQERRLREEMERRRQEEERLKEEARLAELARQAEIARQQGKGGLDWYLAKPLPEFGPVDPFETRLTGETVGNLVPDDYYRFTLSRNGRVTAELRQLLADADLVLYDVRNRPIAYSMRDGITDEHLIADLIPGTYLIRVNSPKGVTTDYELIVKFQHLLSRTQTQPLPPGWRPGGGNGSGGGTTGPIFSDSRIQRIYDTALNNFAALERAKANARIQQLERDKQSYQQELQQLLDQMNGEQRNKVNAALDGIRDERRAWVDSVANPIKNGIDNTADWIINQIESKIPSQAYNIPWFGDQLRSAKDSLKGGINGARSWFKAKVDWVQTGVKDAIWQFTEALKNAYRTGAEINGAIETAAQQLKQKIDGLAGNINNWVNEFKGKVLDSIQWLRNVGVNIPDIKDFWGHTLIPGFQWNFYDSVVEPLANSLANGIQGSVNSVGNFAKGTVDWIKPRAQTAVAAIVDAIFGDKTGILYNKIHGVDRQIEATKTGLEREISDHGALYKRLLDDFVNGLGSAGNFVIGALMGEFNDEPSIWQTLLDTVIGMIPIVGEIGDVRDVIAYIKKFIENPQEMQDPWNWVGVVGSLIGLVPVVGGAIKGVTKLARNADLVKEINKLGEPVINAIVDFARKTDWSILAKQSSNLLTNKILGTIEWLLTKLDEGIEEFKNIFRQLNFEPALVGVGRFPDEGFFTQQLDAIRQLKREAPQKVDEAFAFVKGKLDEVVSSRVPAPDNYRGRYNADRAAKGLPRLPDDWDAHHSIPQFYQAHPEFQDFDFHDPSNIRGVKGSRADENIHQKITNDWAGFQRDNPNANRLQIEEFAKKIDQEYSHHWFK